MQELAERFITGTGVFSASSLNTYIDCPLRFYYQHVRRIKEQDEVVEEVDSSLFGDIYHKVMQHVYTPFTGRTVTREQLEKIRSDKESLESFAIAAFREAGFDELEGENRILLNLVLRYVDRTLEVDAGMTPFTFLGAEADRKCRLALPDGREVRLFGYIDRLDTNVPGTVRVVDYKTGTVDKKDDCRNVDRIFDRSLQTRPYIAFQLYFYALLMSRQQETAGQVFEPCIYALRDIFKAAPQSHAIEPEKLSLFADRVQALVGEIFDPDTPFAGDCTNEMICENCPFKRLCNR